MLSHAHDPVVKLLNAHLADSLRAYSGNLTHALHVVQSNWLPATDSSEIQQHLQTLRQYMEDSGHPEHDEFLLRLALTAPGTQRGIMPPTMVLEPNRGGFSVRRQREAQGQILRLREALTLGCQLRPELTSDTQQAIEVLAGISTTNAPSDREWLRLFQELSADEANQMAERAIGLLDTNLKPIMDIGTEILQRLACFRESPLTKSSCHALIVRHIFWPTSLYRDSGDEVAIEILSHIESQIDPSSLRHQLLALAWTRSMVAHEAFRRWNIDAPSWNATLNLSPADYLPSAGWCLDENVERRELISTTCFRLEPADRSSERTINCRKRLSDDCPSCGGRVSSLVDFSRLGRLFPDEFVEAPRQIIGCLHCARYEPCFVAHRGDGTWEWLSPLETRESVEDENWQSCLRQADDSHCPTFICAKSFGLNDATTLGGIPMWLQGDEFPRCIECGHLMVFVAQHDTGP